MNRWAWMMALLAASSVALAAQLQLRPGMMGVADIGASDCAMFSEMHYNGPMGMRHHVLTWVQGYVYAKTGSNIDAMLAKMPADNGWDFDSLTDVFVHYCREYPDAKVADAAVVLWTVLNEGSGAPAG